MLDLAEDVGISQPNAVGLLAHLRHGTVDGRVLFSPASALPPRSPGQPSARTCPDVA